MSKSFRCFVSYHLTFRRLFPKLKINSLSPSQDMHCLWSELLLMSRNILISLSEIKKFLLTSLKWLAFLKGCDENVINLKVLSINCLKNRNLKHEKNKKTKKNRKANKRRRNIARGPKRTKIRTEQTAQRAGNSLVERVTQGKLNRNQSESILH